MRAFAAIERVALRKLAMIEAAAALAHRIGVPPNRVSEIAAGRRAVTGDTALRLAAAFGTTAEFWMNLQKGWELAVARGEARPEILPVEGFQR